MSYHFFSENEILGPEAISPNLTNINLDSFSISPNYFNSCYDLEPASQFSNAEQFIHKAELTNIFRKRNIKLH